MGAGHRRAPRQCSLCKFRAGSSISLFSGHHESLQGQGTAPLKPQHSNTAPPGLCTPGETSLLINCQDVMSQRWALQWSINTNACSQAWQCQGFAVHHPGRKQQPYRQHTMPWHDAPCLLLVSCCLSPSHGLGRLKHQGGVQSKNSTF
jgi:hypothetical protein